MDDIPRRQAVILQPGSGRTYRLPTMTAIFKADNAETGERSSISEWWLDPGCEGPGAHHHDANDEIFYVIAGRPSVLVGDRWVDGEVGAFFFIPAGVIHDFANRTTERAGLLNVFIPGGFEQNMPSIVEWFEHNPPG